MTAETITLIVTPRDRFSSSETCLEKIFDHTTRPFELIVVMGGAPEKLKKSLQKQYGKKARFIFNPNYENTSTLRNVGLRLARTRLAACLDTDVFVRAGWLEPLLACEQETDAALVVPMVLDRDDRVHTAGNDLFITSKDGKKFCTMELRYAHAAVGDTTNLVRRKIDFGEVHCQLIRVREALDLGFYDERYREGSDIDSGLTLQKANRPMFVEPASVVYLHYPDRLDDAQDVRYYLWKWNLRETLRSFDYFKQKWNLDRTGRDGDSAEYYKMVLNRVGYWTRLCPIQAVITLDNAWHRSRRSLKRGLSSFKRSLKEKILGDDRRVA